MLHGVLEAVEERIEPAGRGKHVFPFNTIKVTIVAVSPDARARFSGVLDGSPRCRSASHEACATPAATSRVFR